MPAVAVLGAVFEKLVMMVNTAKFMLLVYRPTKLPTGIFREIKFDFFPKKNYMSRFSNAPKHHLFTVWTARLLVIGSKGGSTVMLLATDFIEAGDLSGWVG